MRTFFYNVSVVSFLFLICLKALPAEVVATLPSGKYVGVKDDSMQSWEKGKRVCVISEMNTKACGDVYAIKKWGAIVKLDQASHEIKKGNKAIRYASRKPSTAVMMDQAYSNEYSGPKLLIALDSQVSLGYVIPSLTFQALLGDHFALGVSPLFTWANSGVGKATAFGAMFSANIYTKPEFRGFWFMGGLSYLSTTVKLSAGSETKGSIGGTLTAGYRFHLSDNIHLGLAFGGNFYSDPQFTLVEAPYSGLHGLSLLSFGVKF